MRPPQNLAALEGDEAIVSIDPLLLDRNPSVPSSPWLCACQPACRTSVRNHVNPTDDDADDDERQL